jgi:hypothetical protein
VVGLSIAVAVESVAVHALIYPRAPLLNLALFVANALTIWWLVRQYRSIGDTPILVSADSVLIRHGSVSADVPRSTIREVALLDWKTVPADTSKGFLKLSGGDDPNVLVSCEPPARVALALGIIRSVSRFGLRLDEPAAFVDTVRSAPH